MLRTVLYYLSEEKILILHRGKDYLTHDLTSGSSTKNLIGLILCFLRVV